jgi:hypothetical protein
MFFFMDAIRPRSHYTKNIFYFKIIALSAAVLFHPPPGPIHHVFSSALCRIKTHSLMNAGGAGDGCPKTGRFMEMTEPIGHAAFSLPCAQKVSQNGTKKALVNSPASPFIQSFPDSASQNGTPPQ